MSQVTPGSRPRPGAVVRRPRPPPGISGFRTEHPTWEPHDTEGRTPQQPGAAGTPTAAPLTHPGLDEPDRGRRGLRAQGPARALRTG